MRYERTKSRYFTENEEKKCGGTMESKDEECNVEIIYSKQYKEVYRYPTEIGGKYHMSIKLKPAVARSQQIINTYTMRSMQRWTWTNIRNLNSILVRIVRKTTFEKGFKLNWCLQLAVN